jgi:hypothetical protein
MISSVTDDRGTPYGHFARQVAKFPREQLLRAIAPPAVVEATARARNEHIEPPVLSFSLAGVARTAFVVARDGQGRNRRSRRNRRSAGVEQVRRLCREYFAVQDPDMREAEEADVSVLLTRIAFEQFGGQFAPMGNLSRSYSLFVEYAAGVPGMPSAAAWEEALGAPLDVFLRTGFALHVAMMANQGVISRRTLEMDHVRRIWEPLDPAEMFAIVDYLFARSLAEHAEVCREAEIRGREKWSFNSLVDRRSLRWAMTWSVPCRSSFSTRSQRLASGTWAYGRGRADSLTRSVTCSRHTSETTSA